MADGYGVAAFSCRLRVLTAASQPDRTGIVGAASAGMRGVAALPGSLAAAGPAMTVGPDSSTDRQECRRISR